MEPNCVFCKVIKGEVSSGKIYEVNNNKQFYKTNLKVQQITYISYIFF